MDPSFNFVQYNSSAKFVHLKGSHEPKGHTFMFQGGKYGLPIKQGNVAGKFILYMLIYTRESMTNLQ